MPLLAVAVASFAAYVGVVHVLRHRRERRIALMDPVKDAQRITQLVFLLEFPFIGTKALEFALYRTYGFPAISSLLAHTGEFEQRCPRRYDDTDLILREILESPIEGERASVAVARLNYLHGRYKISNDDMKYTLSVFVFEPRRWVDRTEWRKMSQNECLALFYYYRNLGGRMGIQDIPESYEEFERFNLEYEERHMRFSRTNKRVSDATIALFLSPFPKLLHPIVFKAIVALMDDRLRDAMGYEPVSPLTKAIVRAALSFRAFLLRHAALPRPEWLKVARTPEKVGPDGVCKPRFNPYENSYPTGYRIEDLGPPCVAGDKKLGKVHGVVKQPSVHFWREQ